MKYELYEQMPDSYSERNHMSEICECVCVSAAQYTAYMDSCLLGKDGICNDSFSAWTKWEALRMIQSQSDSLDLKFDSQLNSIQFGVSTLQW